MKGLKNASAQNIVTLQRLLTEPELGALALGFLNAFLPFQTAYFEVMVYSTLRLFHGVGTFHDDIIIKITDNKGGLHFVEVALLRMRPGNTWGYWKADRDYHNRFREKKGTHFAGRRVHCLYFMQFETEEQAGFHVEKFYTFESQPFSVRFDCFELPKVKRQLHSPQTEREHWSYWLSHDCPSSVLPYFAFYLVTPRCVYFCLASTPSLPRPATFKSLFSDEYMALCYLSGKIKTRAQSCKQVWN